VNSTGHQTRTEPKDYTDITTCNKGQDKKGKRRGVGLKLRGMKEQARDLKHLLNI